MRRISQSTGVIDTVMGNGVHGSVTGNALTTAELWNPWGISFGSSGTMYLTDYGVYHERYDSIAPATVNFATAVPVGGTSATAQYLYHTNVGTTPLTLAAVSITAGFITTPALSTVYADCAAGTVLQPGDSCVVAVEFQPVTGGTISGTLTITDNSANAAANAHTAALAGLSAVQTQTLLTAAPATTVDQGTSVTFTATVSVVAGQTIPTGAAALGGTVQFSDGTNPIGAAVTIDPVTGIAVSPATVLTAGTHTINAVFTPATTDYSTSKMSLTEVVVAPSFSIVENFGGLQVQTGSSVPAAFTITAVGGYKGTITASCTNLPTNLACNYTPSVGAIFTADGTQTLTVNFISSSATGSLVRTNGAVLAGLLGLPVLLLLARRRKLAGMLAVVLLMAATVGMSGCNDMKPNPTVGTYGVTVNFSDGKTVGGGSGDDFGAGDRRE